MFQFLCLLLVASAAFAMEKPEISRIQDEKYELLKNIAEKVTDANLAETLIDIILDQRSSIKVMEKKMDTMTDTVKKQGNQITGMQGHITELEAKIQTLTVNTRENSQKEKSAIETNEVDGYMTKNETYYTNKDKIRRGFPIQVKPNSGLLKKHSSSMKKRTASHVAFSTYLTQPIPHARSGQIIKLDSIFLNDGNGYNKITGIFTVPTSGVYLLTYSMETTSKTNHLEVELVVDNINMGTVLAYNFGTLASKTILTRLTSGQSVWLESTYYSDAQVRGDTVDNTFNKFVTFSGVLLY